MRICKIMFCIAKPLTICSNKCKMIVYAVKIRFLVYPSTKVGKYVTLSEDLL